MARFRHAQRQGEVQYDEAWLHTDGFEIRHVPEDLHFEGAGDALFCGETLFAGYRIRSHARGHQQIGEMLGCRVIPVELVDPYYYHLDTCFCPLAPGQAIYFPPAFDDYGRAALEAHVDELIEVECRRSPALRLQRRGRGAHRGDQHRLPAIARDAAAARLHAARNAAG